MAPDAANAETHGQHTVLFYPQLCHWEIQKPHTYMHAKMVDWGYKCHHGERLHNSLPYLYQSFQWLAAVFISGVVEHPVSAWEWRFYADAVTGR